MRLEELTGTTTPHRKRNEGVAHGNSSDLRFSGPWLHLGGVITDATPSTSLHRRSARLRRDEFGGDAHCVEMAADLGAVYRIHHDHQVGPVIA